MADLRFRGLSGGEVVLSEAQLRDWMGAVRGRVIRRGEKGYDEARAVWNGMIDRHPELILYCTGVADVIRTINFARTHELLISVRGGGHNVAGSAVCDGGLLIDLSLLNGVRVDPAAHTARAGGGARWADVDFETQAFGLATPGGMVSDTGIGGLTLSGGMGWLRRRHGLSCDNLIGADVVTADGQFLSVSEHEHPDLLWGLRGGGGNFGVVTSFEFRLHHVGPVEMALVVYPAGQAGQVLRGYRDYCAQSPDEVTTLAAFMDVPGTEAFPEQVRGRRAVGIIACCVAPPEEGERLVQPLRDLGEPIADLSGPTSYLGMQRLYDEDYPAGGLYYWKSLYLDDLSDLAIDALVAGAIERPSAATTVELWQLGGAMSRVNPTATAFGMRQPPFLLNIESNWTARRDSDRNIAWTRALWNNMRPFSQGGVYLNMPGFDEEGSRLVQTAFGPNYERLVELKNRYDPLNLFCMNQNITPTARLRTRGV